MQRNEIKTFNFKPISNDRQQLYTISIAEYLQQEAVFHSHRLCFYTLLFVTQGSAVHLVDFQEYRVSKGDVLIIRPGQVHAFLEAGDVEGNIIAFTEEFLLHKSRFNFLPEHLKFLSELYFDFLFHLDADKRQMTDALICIIQQELSTPYDELQETMLQNHLSSLLLSLLRIKRAAGQQPSPQKSKELLYALEFRRLIEKSCRKQLTIPEYAQELGISIRALQKISQLYFGRTPKCVVQEFIVLESKRMLTDHSLQVKEIAYELGFDEQTNFTKFFKKFTGISPEQFRKSIL